MSLGVTEVTAVRKELLGLATGQRSKGRSYGVVIKVNSWEKSNCFFATRRFVNAPVKHSYFPAPDKPQDNDIEIAEFKPKRVQVRKYCKDKWRKEGKEERAGEKAEVKTTPYSSRKEEVLASLKKIRTLALQLKAFRSKPRHELTDSPQCRYRKRRTAVKSQARKRTYAKNKTIDFPLAFQRKDFAESRAHKTSSFVELFNLANAGTIEAAMVEREKKDDEERGRNVQVSSPYYRKISEGIISEEDSPVNNKVYRQM